MHHISIDKWKCKSNKKEGHFNNGHNQVLQIRELEKKIYHENNKKSFKRKGEEKKENSI